MLSGSAAFERVLAIMGPELAGRGFRLLEERDSPEAFGSRFATFGDGRRVVRLTWDGRERWIVLEGDPEPHRSVTGQPIWIDLTLQHFDPTTADVQWAAEVAEDVRGAFLDFVD